MPQRPQSPPEQCVVCLEHLCISRGEQHLTQLSCGHTYHKECIAQWLRCNNRCPLCRTWQGEGDEPSRTNLSGQVLLAEMIDENWNPSHAETLDYAVWLGLDLELDFDLLWIAHDGLKAPLPAGWFCCQADEGEIFYFDSSSGESVWDHPSDEHFRELYLIEKARKASRRRRATDQPSNGRRVVPATAPPIGHTFRMPHAPDGLQRLESPGPLAGRRLVPPIAAPITHTPTVPHVFLDCAAGIGEESLPACDNFSRVADSNQLGSLATEIMKHTVYDCQKVTL